MKTPVLGCPHAKHRPLARHILRDQKTHSSVLHLVWPLSLLLALFAATAGAQEVRPTESQVKAAYLYNFGKFITWPGDRASTPDSLNICVLGKDPFGAVLDSTVAGESIGGRKITVSKLSRVDEATSCSILFISSSEQKRLGSILVAAQRLDVLTVSDMPHFAEQGGMIAFVTEDGKIRFEVNLGAAQQSHLALSSELLKVATRVIGKGAPAS
jgi:hypothetical protein